MRDYARDAESDHGLRLEDVSRRSACDRCRTMKTRCERSHHRGMARLEQCRRCKQAQIKCITTIETEQHWSDIEWQPSRRHRKRLREDSVEANSTYAIPATPQSLDEEQPNSAQPDRYLAHAAFDTPSFFSIPTTSNHTDGLLPKPGIDSQWEELSRMVNLEGSEIPNLDSDMAILSVNHNSHTQDLTGSKFMPSATMPKIPRTGQFDLAASVDRNFLLDSPSLLSASDFSGTETPQTEANLTIIHKLIDFNTELLQDLQDARETDRARGEGRDMLRKILHHSNVFLELLGSFTRLRETPSRKSPHTRGTGSYHVDGAGGLCTKVDTDLALQLLSCHTNMSSLYQVLCRELTTQTSPQLDGAQALTALGLEGLQNLDRNMRLQVLVHICSLTFAQIQKELNSIRGRGTLTPGADAIFQAVLGREEWNRAVSPVVFDENQILARFRQLVNTRSSSSLSSLSSS